MCTMYTIQVSTVRRTLYVVMQRFPGGSLYIVVYGRWCTRSGKLCTCTNIGAVMNTLHDVH